MNSQVLEVTMNMAKTLRKTGEDLRIILGTAGNRGP